MAKHGFSLTELIVSIAIMTLLTLLSLPLLNNYKKISALRNETHLLATNLRLTQQHAVTEQVVYKLEITPNIGQYQIINTVTNDVITTTTLDPLVSITSITGLTNNAAQFTPTGGAIETGSIILSSANAATTSVSIKPSGYVEVSE